MPERITLDGENVRGEVEEKNACVGDRKSMMHNITEDEFVRLGKSGRSN